MRKKSFLTLLVLTLFALTSCLMVACVDSTEPIVPTPGPIEVTRDDCNLVFGGEGGIAVDGILAPSDSDLSIGGAVTATVALKATGADLRVVSSITKLKITLKSGVVENMEDSVAIANILTMAFDKESVDLVKDTETASVFTFTMPPTDDMKYMGATFVISVRLTVTHADGKKV